MRTSCKRVRFFVSSLLFFPLFVLAVGCGSKEGSISGKVYYKGQLVTAGSVNFVPEGGKHAFASQIKKDGTYSVSKVPPGPAKIGVVTGSSKPPTAADMKQMGRGAQRAQKGMEEQKSRLQEKGKPAEAGGGEAVHVPEKYSDPENSGLKVDVTGGKQQFDIKIE